jgi:hypothetical protein
LDTSLVFFLNSSSESFRVVLPDIRIFFKYELDISLNHCRCIQALLDYVPPTVLALVFMSLVDYRC